MNARTLLGPAARTLASAYRRTGADLPFGNPLPTHGTEMEGWFWRLSDPATGRVAGARCAASTGIPAGDWSTAAIARAPGAASSARRRSRRSAPTPTGSACEAETDGYALAAERDRLRMVIDDCAIDATFHDGVPTGPRRSAAAGSSPPMPFLNQYWHPYRLGGRAAGTVTVGERHWSFDDADGVLRTAIGERGSRGGGGGDRPTTSVTPTCASRSRAVCWSSGPLAPRGHRCRRAPR